MDINRPTQCAGVILLLIADCGLWIAWSEGEEVRQPDGLQTKNVRIADRLCSSPLALLILTSRLPERQTDSQSSVPFSRLSLQLLELEMLLVVQEINIGRV